MHYYSFRRWFLVLIVVLLLALGSGLALAQGDDDKEAGDGSSGDNPTALPSATATPFPAECPPDEIVQSIDPFDLDPVYYAACRFCWDAVATPLPDVTPTWSLIQPAEFDIPTFPTSTMKDAGGGSVGPTSTPAPTSTPELLTVSIDFESGTAGTGDGVQYGSAAGQWQASGGVDDSAYLSPAAPRVDDIYQCKAGNDYWGRLDGALSFDPLTGIYHGTLGTRATTYWYNEPYALTVCSGITSWSTQLYGWASGAGIRRVARWNHDRRPVNGDPNGNHYMQIDGVAVAPSNDEGAWMFTSNDTPGTWVEFYVTRGGSAAGVGFSFSSDVSLSGLSIARSNTASVDVNVSCFDAAGELVDMVTSSFGPSSWRSDNVAVCAGSDVRRVDISAGAASLDNIILDYVDASAPVPTATPEPTVIPNAYTCENPVMRDTQNQVKYTGLEIQETRCYTLLPAFGFSGLPQNVVDFLTGLSVALPEFEVEGIDICFELYDLPSMDIGGIEISVEWAVLVTVIGGLIRYIFTL